MKNKLLCPAPRPFSFRSRRYLFAQNPAVALCAAVWIFTLVLHSPLWIERRICAPAFQFLTVCAFALSIRRLPLKEAVLNGGCLFKAYCK